MSLYYSMEQRKREKIMPFYTVLQAVVWWYLFIPFHRQLFGGTFYDTQRDKLGFTQFIIRMAAWLLLTFFICLHNQLSSLHSNITY